jgi:hypothetical protein
LHQWWQGSGERRGRRDFNVIIFYEHEGIAHPIMVVNDCTLMLYANYSQIASEIGIVLSIMDGLLKDIIQQG